MSACLFGLAILFFIIGLVQLFAPDGKGAGQTGSRPGFGPARPVPSEARQTATQRAASTGPAMPPGPTYDSGGAVMLNQQKLNWIKNGQRIFVKHPVKGELMAHVLGSILYAELWQQTRGPQSPWAPTGNAFAGFWLEGGMFLLNWQNRFYLFDEALPLSDADIQRDFAPHARKFAQSDQTADVYFAYPPAMWHIDDIGKFRVEQAEGEGLRFSPGAIGRFIHASGDSARALVIEDYEGGGGGQDTAWIGYQITEDDLRPES